MNRFYGVPKALLQLKPLYLLLYVELRRMETYNVVTTTRKELSLRLGIGDQIARRMLIKLAELGFISIEPSPQHTKITLPPMEHMQDWVKIPHEATLTSAWRKGQQHKCVFLCLMLSCSHSTIRELLTDIAYRTGQASSDLLDILEDLAADDMLLHENNNGVLTVQLLMHPDYYEQPMNNQQTTIEQPLNNHRTTIEQPLYMDHARVDLDQNQKKDPHLDPPAAKKEEREALTFMNLAQELHSALAEKKIEQQPPLEVTSKILCDSDLSPQQIQSGIKAYQNTAFIEGVYSPKSFCNWLLAEEAKRQRLEQRQKEREKEEREALTLRNHEHKAFQTALAADPALLAKIHFRNGNVKLGLSSLAACLSAGEITKQEHDCILQEEIKLKEAMQAGVA